MGESTGLRGASGEILSLHKSIICGGCAKRNAIAIVIRADASKTRAPSNSAFEMIDV